MLQYYFLCLCITRVDIHLHSTQLELHIPYLIQQTICLLLAIPSFHMLLQFYQFYFNVDFNRVPPSGLPATLPYPLPYNPNSPFPIETTMAKSNSSFNVDKSNPGKLSSIAILPSSHVNHGNLSDNKRQYLSALCILQLNYYDYRLFRHKKGVRIKTSVNI